jgi:hypothetical protein
VSGVEVINRANRSETLHRRAGEVREELDRVMEQIDRAFAHMEKAKTELLDAGSRWEPVLAPPLEAAYGAWKKHGARDHRIELAQVAEAPLPEEQP